ncbi:MAG: lytic transglycosylase domain-containing protein [Undibacterium sp.]|nr:lytic transglycosylase domain-containing protein [Undibacterium sp.]MDO8652299.1 lytic transglycosylase domain-containing protein [Undibacterium sp.]
MMLLGMCSISLLAVMFIRPDLIEKFKNLSPFNIDEQTVEVNQPSLPNLKMLMATPQQIAQVQPNEVENKAITTEEDSKILGNQRQQQWVTTWLAKRYRVATDASNMLVSAAYLTAKDIKLDPLLILSVMAIESGLNPFAESPVGAQGLMQVMSKVHHEKFQDMGGIKAALNPVANIKVGALILKDYVTRGGSIEAGLKLYVGAAAFDNDAGYGTRVLAEYRRLKDVSTGKNVPTYTTTSASISVNRPQETASEVKTDKLIDSKVLPIEQKHQDQLATL